MQTYHVAGFWDRKAEWDHGGAKKINIIDLLLSETVFLDIRNKYKGAILGGFRLVLNISVTAAIAADRDS